MLFAASTAFVGCSDDDLDSKSVFDGTTVERSDFDNWLLKNYVEPYNINMIYRYSDKDADQNYNVTPAKAENALAIAKLIRHMWVDAYVEAVSADFLKTYTPRVIQLTGSYKYDTNGQIVLGTAEQGMKVMFYGVNDLDIDNLRVNTDNPYESKSTKPLDLNYWFFHTMHHEFCHILTQTKNYSTDFQTISAGGYHATDWVNVTDQMAAPEGFVTGYASQEYNEDFAETYATYVTLSEAGWNKIIAQAGTDGAAVINQKLAMVREYFITNWGIDLDTMRSIILRRSSAAELSKINLRTLD